MSLFQSRGEKGNEKRSKKKKKKKKKEISNRKKNTQTTIWRFTDTHFTIVPFGNVITN